MVFVSYLKNYGCSCFPFFVVRLIIGAYGPLFADIIKFRQSGPSFLATMYVLAAVFDSGSPLFVVAAGGGCCSPHAWTFDLVWFCCWMISLQCSLLGSSFLANCACSCNSIQQQHPFVVVAAGGGCCSPHEWILEMLATHIFTLPFILCQLYLASEDYAAKCRRLRWPNLLLLSSIP